MLLYEQTTGESCLATSLLQAVNEIMPIRISDHEHACLFHALSFCKEDFVVGHLDYLTKHFPVEVNRIVDNEPYAQFLVTCGIPKHTVVTVAPIDLSVLEDFISQGQRPIIYLDCYDLLPTIHYPHFVTVMDVSDFHATIVDPWDGLEKEIGIKTLEHAIESLRTRLKTCPQLLLVSKQATQQEGERYGDL